MTKDERIKKSYDFAADLSKQMITLSTAIITLCVAFTVKVFTSGAAQANSCWLMWSLGVFVFSIAVGVFHLMGLTGQLGREDVVQAPDINNIPFRVLTCKREDLKEAKADVILVHGDTTTRTASALSAFYRQSPVGRVDAGLRTNSIHSPSTR